MKIKILGQDWTVKYKWRHMDNFFEKQNCDGYCDNHSKTIVVMRQNPSEFPDKNPKTYMNLVLRHEIVHAFLYESGLENSSGPTESWAVNEEMVDWFAHQGPKIMALWQKLNIL